MDFIVLARKPRGITSAKFLNLLKIKLGEKKMGHSGTLDKFAEGLLVCATGKFTKRLSDFLLAKKEYIAEIELGKESVTLDREGPFKKTADVLPSEEKVKEALFSFPVDKLFLQEAPLYSAKKLGGKRLSDLARGKKKAKPRSSKVKIYNIKFLNYTLPILKISISVSSGFYVRSFARDIGRKLGTGAYLKRLFRTKIGEVSFERAFSLDDTKDILEVEGFFKKKNIKNFEDFFQKELSFSKIKWRAKKIQGKIVYFILQGKLQEMKNFLEKIKEKEQFDNVSDYLFYLQKPKRNKR